VKILACTDGSKISQKVLEEAARIAGSCNADEVVIIYVDNRKPDISGVIDTGSYIRPEDAERLAELINKHREEKERILAEALSFFEMKNIKASTLLEKGHPAEVITDVAAKGAFDLIVIGNRGLGGLQKLFLGSISNAVVQLTKSSVLIVK
jgi:nucleotide-binding universal stress UspA family protein